LTTTVASFLEVSDDAAIVYEDREMDVAPEVVPSSAWTLTIERDGLLLLDAGELVE
jgi:hypothetical protein